MRSRSRYPDGCKSDVNIYLVHQVNLKPNALFKNLMTAALKTPVVSHDLELQIFGLVFVCRLPCHWRFQNLCA